MQENHTPDTQRRQREKLDEILALCETAAYRIIERMAAQETGAPRDKDMPGQLLKLVQLLEKVQEMLAKVEAAESRRRVKVNPAIIRKYLDKYEGDHE